MKKFTNAVIDKIKNIFYSLPPIRKVGLGFVSMALVAQIFVIIINPDDEIKKIVLFLSIIIYLAWLTMIVISSYYTKTSEFLDALWMVLLFMSFKFVMLLVIGDSDFINNLNEKLGISADKEQWLYFISVGMGGVAATIGAGALSLTLNARVHRNRWSGIKSASKNIVNDKSLVRITAYYQYYQLAKDQGDIEFKQNICNILCVRWRKICNDENKSKTIESQILSDILLKFKNEMNVTYRYVGDYKKNCDDQNYLTALCQK